MTDAGSKKPIAALVAGAAAVAVALKLVARRVAPVTPPVALPKQDA